MDLCKICKKERGFIIIDENDHGEEIKICNFCHELKKSEIKTKLFKKFQKMSESEIKKTIFKGMEVSRILYLIKKDGEYQDYKDILKEI